MNRLLDRKIADAAGHVVALVERSRIVMLATMAELASGKRQLELADHGIVSCHLLECMAAYNALVMLRAELGE